MQREILWALADSGECSLPVLLNSLPPKYPEFPPAPLIKEVGRSLGILYRAGCLYLTRATGGERKHVPAHEMAALNLGRMLSWVEGGVGFVVSEGDVADVIVLLTNGGAQWLEVTAAQSGKHLLTGKP
ncbi:MAG TPA: hypothetical protein VGB73_13175 [Pyrinomonadaceae bacterium]